jgi:ribonuclease HII
VVAAAVVLTAPLRLPVDDSKRLPPGRRSDLCRVIRERAVAVAHACVEADEIDRTDILRASLAAMRAAVERAGVPPEFLLVDGTFEIPGVGAPQRAIVAGDARCASIAAASIIAKVERDRIMVAYDEIYPGYGFARHKGYGTPSHLAALERLGPSPIHRCTFRPLTFQGVLAF